MAFSALIAGVLSVAPPRATAAESPNRPNILFVLADDMGWGDPQCFNPESKIPTPNIDRLAREGMKFTDAHAPGSVCVPSRYGLLTGRYPFRAEHLRPNRGALIEPDRLTLASLLRSGGYATAMVGKWHEGFDGGDAFDYAKPLRGGPFDRGFDYFFGQHASLDIPPYFYIENDRCVEPPTARTQDHNSPGWSPIQGAFWRKGDVAPGYKHEDVLPTYTRKSVEYVEGRGNAEDGKPFFLYVALTAPHTPWLPAEEFRGKSGASMYGDFTMQVDASIGRILSALDRAGFAQNTLVFFSSDNGPVWLPENVENFGHSSAGGFRGMKGDAWEAGHRMPFIARWPDRVAAGSTCSETICFTDMLATFAAVSGTELPPGAGEDSVSILPLLESSPHDKPLREVTLIGRAKDRLAVRSGDWKLIPFLGSGGFSNPRNVKPGPGDPPGQLYNLADDPGETKNLYADRPEIVARLMKLAKEYIENGRGNSSAKR